MVGHFPAVDDDVDADDAGDDVHDDGGGGDVAAISAIRALSRRPDGDGGW